MVHVASDYYTTHALRLANPQYCRAQSHAAYCTNLRRNVDSGERFTIEVGLFETLA